MAIDYTCSCKKSFKNGRALHAHKLTCRVAAGARVRSSAGLKCDCKDGGSWELLTDSTEGAEEFVGQINPDTGRKYKKWCTQCKEVV